MEVDERLRWLESRVNSSLRPKGEKLRTFFADSDNRLRFLDFCNNSETRHLFVHLPPDDDEGAGTLCVSPHPPDSLQTKALFFIKNSHTSRLNKDTISDEVACNECSEDPIEFLELVLREVYLPLLAEQKDGTTTAAVSAAATQGISAERIMDILHRMISNIQVTQGHQTGDLVLPIPSLDILVEGAASGNNERRAVVVHIMESCVISWMKQVKMAMHFDPNGAIAKSHGKMAGPMAEIKFWENRHQQLLLVRSQLNSVEVLRILNGLEHARSTYADAFIDVHRDLEKSIIDTELALMYVNTLKPWFQKLEGAFSPDTLTDLFPSLVTTISLAWQHSSLYAQSTHFSRLLRLISNKLALKARDIVGVDPLETPIQSCVCIRQALRVCSAFRGYYLDRRDVAEKVMAQNRERLIQLQQESIHGSQSKESTFDQASTVGDSSIISFSRQGHHGIDYPLCSWPPRNAPVFSSLNSTLERCNDLLELVQTIEHFSELSSVADQASSEGKDPILIDVYHQFQTTLEHFRNSTKDLMSLEQVGFEKSFFEFRSSVKELEAQLSEVLLCYFNDCLTLEPSLRLLESFQGLISRESIQSVLSPKLYSIIDSIQSDVDGINDSMMSFVTDPPLIINTPPTSSKLLWLRALRERMDVPIERVRAAAPYLLQGEKGFTLRHTHGKIIKSMEKQWNGIVNIWKKSLSDSIDNVLLHTLLKQDESGELQVNFSLSLEMVLREMHYLSGPLLSVTLPQSLSSISLRLSPQILHQYRVSLEVCMRQYNAMQKSLDTVHRALFQHKLSLLDKLLEEGLAQWNWLSMEVPDFLAKLKASLQTDLLPAVQCVLQQTKDIQRITDSWTELVTLDMFRENERSSLELLSVMYSELVESAERVLCSSMVQIEVLFKKAYECVEVSWDSPAWLNYLYYLDGLVLKGLKLMILHSMHTLTSRAQKYEQGGSIPPMVTVSLELYEKDIEFSPPLSSRSSLPSVPERIKQFLEGFVSLSKSLHSRLYPQSTQSYYQVISTDPDVLGNLQKITAHVETSARQCQSLRKRFSQYSFLWEQDVLATFDDFINGIGQPHPRRFTRPESTVNKSRSASARSRAHSAAPNLQVSSQTASSVLESVTGHSDWEFLKPDRQSSASSTSSSASASHSSSSSETTLTKDVRKPRHPMLEDFDGEIAVFQGVLERLYSSVDTVDVGWICVDQGAVKNALTSLAKKWTYIYANYLEKKVLLVLRELEVFFTDIEPQVEAISGDTIDPDHIMTLVTIFNKVNLQQLVMDGKFGAVHRAVAILDKFHQPLPPQTRDHFEGIPHRWTSLKKRLALSKQRIAPFIQSHSATITRDLEAFGSEAKRQHQSFLNSPCLSHQCDPPVAQDLIKEYVQILLGLRAQAKDLMELQELLQSPIVNFSILNQFEDELTNANLLWERQHIISEYHTNIKTHIWLTVDFDEMRDACQEHTDLLMSLGDCTGHWDARVHFQEAVKEVQHTVPLLEGLSSRHMRPRHWKQVLRYSTNHSLMLMLMKNGTLDMSTLRHLTLGRFMDLKLTYYNSEILGIVDRASKEVAIEELLKNLEEVWLGMQFQLKPFYRLHGHEQAVSDIGVEAGRISSLSHNSPVVRKKSISSGRVSVISATPNVADKLAPQEVIMLLDDVDKIFDALDHYQTSLKSLEGSLAATSFTEELQHWHKQLQTVEAVLRAWLQVQTLWVLLEEVLTSAEAAQHLPTTHFNFSSINKEWKQLLKSTAKSPNVIQCCLQEDLLQTLEKFLNTLSQCQSVLLQYVQCKSARCPWLYFLTLEDALQLVCYSSNVSVLCKIIPKIILHSTGLLFNNNNTVSDSLSHEVLPRITGLTGNGGEKLELFESIDCDGVVDIILNHLIHSVTETLKQQLNHSLTKSAAPSTPSHPSPLPPSVRRLSSLWSSGYSHQVIQLGFIIILEERLSEEIEKTKGGPMNASGLLSEIQTGIQILHSLHQGKQQSTDLNTTHTSTSKGLGEGAYHDNDEQWSDTHLESRNDPVTTSTTPVELYRNLILILLGYRERVKEVSTQSDPLQSFLWVSSVHYSYDRNQRSCHMTSLGVALTYGFHYSGGYSLFLTQPTERVAVHLLKVLSQHMCGIVANQKSGSVSDVAVSCGYPLFPLQCSQTTPRDALINSFKGISSTGSWLYLCKFDMLPLSLIQVTVQLVTAIREAKTRRSQTVKLSGENIKTFKLDTSFCIGNTTISPSSPLPSFVFSVFKTYSLQEAPSLVIYEAMLLSKGFVSAVSPLSLFLSHYSAENGVSKADVLALLSLSHQHIKDYHTHHTGGYFNQQQQHYNLQVSFLAPPPPTVLSSSVASRFILSHLSPTTRRDSHAPSREGLAPPPLPVLYEEEEGGEAEDARDERGSDAVKGLEVLSVLVSLWELQLPLQQGALLLVEEYFTDVSVSAVLEELEKGQAEVVGVYSWSREAVEFAQESRAASAMLSSGRGRNTKLQNLESAILEACLVKGLVPSHQLLKSVHSLVQLVLFHRVVRVTGSWEAGRRECIELTAEVIKSTGYSLSMVSLPIDAMHTGGLLGEKDAPGVLSQLLRRLSPSVTNSMQLIVLEEGRGSLCDSEEGLSGCLEWICNEEETLLHFPNMSSILLDPSVKFILTCSSDTDDSYRAKSIPTLSLGLDCISWEHRAKTSFLQLERETQEHLTLLCQQHIPGLIELIYSSNDNNTGSGTSVNAAYTVLSHQSLSIHQLMTSFCKVLKCVLANITRSISSSSIERVFTYALIWTFGAAMTKEGRRLFEEWLRKSFPEPLSTLEDSLWHYRLSLSTLHFDICRPDSTTNYVYSQRRKALSEFIQLLYTNNGHLILDGVCGSGKTAFLIDSITASRRASSSNSSSVSSGSSGGSELVYSLMHTYVNQLSNPATFWSQLQENLVWHSGRTYLPQGSERLVALVDDVHLSQMTSLGSILSLIAHHITSGTVLAPTGYKDHKVGGITYILSTDSTQSTLDPETISNLVYIHWEEYSTEELVFIYTTLLKTHFSGLSDSLISQLVQTAVQIHTKLQNIFIDNKDRRHYTFTSTVLDATLKSLTLHCDRGVSLSELLHCWLCESYWHYAAQLTTTVDRERYQECVDNALKKYFSESSLLPSLLQYSPLSCVSGERLLEERLISAQQELDTLSPTPPISLYDFTLTLSLHLSHLLEEQRPLSSVLLIGMGHVEHLLLLITGSHGYSLQRPSQVHTSSGTASSPGGKGNVKNGGGVEGFRAALKTIYTNAGVRNERVVVFLDDQELLHSSYIPLVYEFVKDCSITIDFTPEERSRIVNSLRSEVTKNGSDYTEQKAWNFFICRLKTNVRLVLSLPDLSLASSCGLLEMKNLLSVIEVCYELAWDRKRLLHVANYHLKNCIIPKSLQESTAHLLTSLHILLRNITASNEETTSSYTSSPIALCCCWNNKFEYFSERFCHEMEEWWSKLSNECLKLDSAIEAFSKAQKKLLSLKERLIREEIVLEEKGKSYAQLLVQIGQDTAIAKEQLKLVHKQSERIEHLQKVLPEYEYVHSLYVEDLERIEHETKEIALNLDQKSLLELRSLNKPPLDIQELLEAVIIIIKLPLADLSWTKGAKRLMANIDRFKEMMMEFSQHQEVSSVLLESLHTYIVRPGFNEETFGKLYLAAGQLCSWVKGVESFHRMLQDNIRRLEYRKSQVKASLQEYTEKLTQLNHKVQVFDERLEGLSTSLEQASIEKTYQNQIVTEMSKELEKTTQFIQLLSSHYTEWNVTRDKLSLALTSQIGQLALTTCYTTYLTSLDPQEAQTIISEHIKPSIIEKGFTLSPHSGIPPLQGILGTTLSDPNPQDSDSNPRAQPIEQEENEDTHQVVKKSMQYQYQSLCTDILLMLNPSVSIQSLPSLSLLHKLYFVLVEHSWNRWTLLYDPDDMATSFLNDKWIILDGQDCSMALLHSIEQGLVEGQWIVINKVTLPLNSLLIPIIEAGLHWQKTNHRDISLDFCGRRIHINKSFRLILSISSLPPNPSTSQLLSCRFNFINASSSSLPLAQELALHEAQRDNNSEAYSLDGYTALTSAIVESDKGRRELSERLLKCLGKVTDGVVDSFVVSEVEEVMKNYDELQELFKSHCWSVESYSQSLMDTASSVCLFASVVFNLLQWLSKSVPNFLVGWSEYSSLFHKVLIQSNLMKTNAVEDEAEEKRRGGASAQFRELLVKSVLSILSRYLNDTQLYSVAYCLHVFSFLDLHTDVGLAQIEYLLLCMTHNDYWTEFLRETPPVDLSPLPEGIPKTLMLQLYSLPLLPSLIESIHHSMIEQPETWQTLLQNDKGLPSSPSSLPWLQAASSSSDQSTSFTLNDLVILSIIMPSGVSLHIEDSVNEIMDSLPLPLLSDVLVRSEGDHPLVLLYDENNLVSQANMINFKSHFKKGQSGEDSQSLLTLSLGVEVELSASSENCVILEDIHLTCLETLALKLQKETQRLIMTLDHRFSMPVQLLNQCQVLSLSRVAPTAQFQQQKLLLSQLESQTNEAHKYLYTLLAVVCLLPQSLLEELDKLVPQKKRKIVFLLCAFHTRICSDLASAQLHSLTYALSQLSTEESPIDVLLQSLHSLLINLYSLDSKDAILEAYVNAGLLEEGGSSPPALGISQDLSLPIPSSSVSPSNYPNHINGIINAMKDTSKINRDPANREQFLTALRSVLSLTVTL